MSNYTRQQLLACLSVVFFVSTSYLFWQKALHKNTKWLTVEKLTARGETAAYQPENEYLHENSTIIYRVFMDYRDRQTHNAALRILALQQCQKPQSPNTLSVSMRMFNGTTLQQDIISEPVDGECPWHWAPSCEWTAHLMSTFVAKEVAHSLAGIALNKHKLSVPITQLANIGKTQPNGTLPPHRHQLAVCVLPIYLFDDFVQMVQFLEIWRYHGATLFLIYYHSVSRTVLEFLRAYEKEGLVLLIPWLLFPKNQHLDPNLSTYRLGHSLAETDCVFRMNQFAKFVALVDFDELVLPNEGKLSEFLNSALELNPNAGSFIFTHNRLAFPAEKPSGKFSDKNVTFEWLRSATLTQDVSPGPTKTIFLPERTLILLNHKVRTHLNNFERVNVNSSQAGLYHARNNWQNTPTEEASDLSHIFSNELVQSVSGNFSKVIQKRFENPANFHWTNETVVKIGICLKNWRTAGCKTPYHSCYAMVKNLNKWLYSTPNRNSANYLII